jgi:hypothetical protein
MNDAISPTSAEAAPPRRRRSRAVLIGFTAAAALAVGVIGGIAGTRLMHRWQPQDVMLLQPQTIGQMKPDSMAAFKGHVAEVFGNKFIVQDDSGRALVDTGPRGEGRQLVEKDEAVTVQGHFDRGMMRAQVLVHADGRTEGFGPPRPPHGRRGPMHGPDGFGPPHGPADRGPPPPPAEPAPAPGN